MSAATVTIGSAIKKNKPKVRKREMDKMNDNLIKQFNNKQKRVKSTMTPAFKSAFDKGMM